MFIVCFFFYEWKGQRGTGKDYIIIHITRLIEKILDIRYWYIVLYNRIWKSTNSIR
jgi:hypothetical protein